MKPGLQAGFQTDFRQVLILPGYESPSKGGADNNERRYWSDVRAATETYYINIAK